MHVEVRRRRVPKKQWPDLCREPLGALYFQAQLTTCYNSQQN